MTTTRVQTRIGQLQIETVGSGPGAMLWHSLLVDSHQWDRVRDSLSEHRTLVMIDGPGHGGSGPPPVEFSLEDCAAAAGEVQDALGIRQVDWIGNAWGGHVGIVLGAQEPQRIKSVVACAAPLHSLGLAERMRIGALVGIYRLLGPANIVTSAVEAALLSPKVRRNDMQAVRLVRHAFDRADRKGMYGALHNMMLRRPDITDSFRSLRIPILLVAGEHDPLWTLTAASDAARLNKRAVAATIERSAHLPPLEAPDLFVRRILEFWERNPATQDSEYNLVGASMPLRALMDPRAQQ